MKTVIRNGYTPATEDYCNTIVVDRENNKKYMFDSDGVWTDMTQPAVTTQADWATENPRDFSYIKNKPALPEHVASEDDVEYLRSLPNSVTLSRIGRKLYKAMPITSSTRTDDGSTDSIQGGCYIDDTHVAYMLWDSINTFLNKNRLIILNLETGDEERTADFNFGWCNSMALDNGLLYVCVRGTNDSGGIAHNNGTVKVVSLDDFSIVNTLELDTNTNAISIKDGIIYALEENSNNVLRYSVNGIRISGDIVLENLPPYNQDIKVGDKFIYITSTRPSNIVSVYKKDGTLVKVFNTKKYAGMYLVGELQFIDTLDEEHFLVAATNRYYEESQAQFYTMSLDDKLYTNQFNYRYAQTLYCDSDSNHFNPDGSQQKPFKSVEEALLTEIEDIVIQGNDKVYPYTHMTSNGIVKVNHCKFASGVWCQYGKYAFSDCEFGPAINSGVHGAFFCRDSEVFMNRAVFTGDGTSCIYSREFNLMKFSACTFNNCIRVMYDTNPTSVIEINNHNNTPYIARSNKEYNLMANGSVSYFQRNTLLPYNCDLTTEQIAEIITNCSKLVIGYTAYNGNCVIETTLQKKGSTSGTYTIADNVFSSGSVNVRLGKIVVAIDEHGINMSTNATTTITPTSMTVTQASESTAADNTMVIKYIKFLPQ